MPELVWFLQPEKTVGAFLLRLAVSGGVALFSYSLLAALFTGQIVPPLSLMPFLTSLLTATFAAGVAGFAFQAGLKLYFIAMARRRMRANLKKAYVQSVAPVETDLSAIPGALREPALVKFSKDIENLGGRFVSTNGGAGYRKPLNLPIITRVAEGVADPEEMLIKHCAALQAVQTTGKRVLPLNPDEILADIARDNEEAREALRRYGYFHWGDAARMVFKLPRPENRM